jgi:hypothetical protein
MNLKKDDHAKHIEDARLKAVIELTIAMEAMENVAGWLRAYTGSNDDERERADRIVVDIRAILRKTNAEPIGEHHTDPMPTPTVLISDEGLLAEGFVHVSTDDPRPV